MKIKNGRIDGVEFVEAHAYDRNREMKPTLIVLHDTAGQLDPKSSVRWFASDECPNSAHIVIERDGTITQCVPFNRRAYHCGISTFEGRANCNDYSIGIELVNPGILDKDGRAWFHKTNPKKLARGYNKAGLEYAETKYHGKGWWMPYTQEQIAAVTNLCKAICGAYPGITDITTHWFIRWPLKPGDKIDTNPLFPLDAVRRAALGIRGEETVAAIEPVTASADINAGDLVSRTIRDANVLKIIGGSIGGGAAAKGLHDANTPASAPAAPAVPDVSLESAGDQLGLIQKVMEGIGSLSKLVVQHYWIAGIIAGIALWWYGRRIIAWYIDDIRTGKREPVFKITKKLIG